MCTARYQEQNGCAHVQRFPLDIAAVYNKYFILLDLDLCLIDQLQVGTRLTECDCDCDCEVRLEKRYSCFIINCFIIKQVNPNS